MKEILKSKLKRYIVFEYGMYYPSGGLSDITGSFDTLEEAWYHIGNSEGYSDYVDILVTLEGVPVVAHYYISRRAELEENGEDYDF